MEHYPDIQRQQGTLFFIPHGDSAAIAMSIERLIDLLDAADGDPDLEANGDERDQSYLDDHLHRHALCAREDDEPYLGWPNAGQRPNNEMSSDLDREEDNADGEPNLGSFEQHPHIWCKPYDGDQSRWASGVVDDREDDGDDLEPSLLSAVYHNGVVEADVEGDSSDDEFSHGWTDHIDQDVAIMHCGGEWVGEGEPELGWTGHGTGVQEGETHHDAEANGDEGDYSPADDCLGFGTIGRDMVRGLPIAAKRADAYAMLGGRSAC